MFHSNNFNKYKKNYYKTVLKGYKLKPKKLNFGLKGLGGRDSKGRIVLYTRGKRIKKSYRYIDFKRSCLYFWNTLAFVLSIEYDSNRSSYIALIQYGNGYLSYIIASEGLKIGSIIGFGNNGLRFSSVGNRFPLYLLSFQIKLHNIGYFAKAAGTFIKICGFLDKKTYLIQIPSGKLKLIKSYNLATVGQVSNVKNYLKKKYKAGQNIKLGKKPIVRGVAMNPVDHPHGGGEGKSSGGRPSVSAWSIYTKGYTTLKKKYEREKKKKLKF